MSVLVSVIAMAGPAAGTAAGAAPPQFDWELLDSGTGVLLNSLDGVSADVAWAASIDGQVLRTVDGGETFDDVSPPDSAEVDFLDVEASSAEDALLLAIGPESVSIYRTSDGGGSWSVPYVSPEAFLTSISMFDRRHGFAVGDPIDGKFQIVGTSDAGRSWELVDPAGMPDAVEEEFAVAFTGNSSAATGRSAFFGTVSGTGGRVFRSADRGHTWEVASTPMPGVSGLDFRTNRLGLAVGEGVSRTTDAGVSWQLADEPPPVFARDVAWWSDLRGDERSAIADAQRTAFTSAGFVSRDRGKTWEQFSDAEFFSIECAEGTLACWASGAGGVIARLTVS